MTDSARRIVLGALAVGIGAMFAVTVAWRMGDHPRVHQHAAVEHTPMASQPAMPSPGEADPTKMKKMGQSPQAMAIMGLMQKMKENPNDVETLIAIAQTFAEQGDAEGAKGMLQRAAVAAPSDSRPPYLMGVVLGGQGKWKEAAEQLERSIVLGDDASTRYSLGVIYRYHLNQEDKAHPHFDMAAKLSQDPALASMIKAELAKTGQMK